MTSSQVNKKNFDNESIKMKITNASPIYLPIPDRELHYPFVFLYIFLEIFNQTESKINLGFNCIFLSELYLDSNQNLKRSLSILDSKKIKERSNRLNVFSQNLFHEIYYLFNRKKIDVMIEQINSDSLNYSIISPSECRNIDLKLRFFFRENLLFLAMSTTSEYFSSSQSTEQFCIFENVEPGEYNLKVICNSTGSQKLEKLKARNPEIIDLEQSLETPSIKLNLLMPTKEEPDTLATPNIKFQNFIIQKDITFPSIKTIFDVWDFFRSRLPTSYERLKPYILLPIYFRVTNQSSKNFRFNFHGFKPPDLIFNGTQINWQGSTFRPTTPTIEDCPIVVPNKSIDFCPDIAIFCSGWNQCKLNLFTRDGFSWITPPIQTGQYQIRFNYNNQDSTISVYSKITKQMELLDDFWIGSISTPFVNLSFSQH